ncbi:MAG: fasciclin domain-containing protein [Granulosicoccus sp.]
MFKKYFALSLIAASVALAGCSDDDEDDDDNGGSVTIPAADYTDDSSAMDVVANSTDHTTLLAAIEATDLADTLDNGDFTIFAPTNDAFPAAGSDDLNTLLADVPALKRILLYHVVQGTNTGTAIGEGVTNATEEAPYTLSSLLEDADDGNLTFTNPQAGLSVNEIVIATADLAPTGEGATGVVHSIGSVLETPPASEEPGGETPVVPGGGGTPSEGAGTVQAAMETAGVYSAFLALFAPQAYDDANNVWTVFAPTDDSIPEGVTPDAQNHIFVGGAVSAADMLANGSITTNAGQTYNVTGTEAALLVDGIPAALIATGDQGTLVYSLEGVLE